MADIKTENTGNTFNMLNYLSDNLETIKEPETIKVPAPPAWPPLPNGDPVMLTVQPLNRRQYQKLFDKYNVKEFKRDEYGDYITGNNGMPVETANIDSYAFLANGIAAMLVDPDLSDREVQKRIGAIDPVTAVQILFASTADFQYMVNVFNDVHKGRKRRDPNRNVATLKN